MKREGTIMFEMKHLKKKEAFFPRILIFKFNEEVLKFNDMRELELAKNYLENNFLNLKYLSFENVSFSQ